MSLILDALNRSATERSSADAAPGIQTVHEPPRDAEVPLWRKILWPSLVVVLAGIAIWLWFDRTQPPVTEDAAPVAESAASPPASLVEAASVEGTAAEAAAVEAAAVEAAAVEAAAVEAAASASAREDLRRSDIEDMRRHGVSSASPRQREGRGEEAASAQTPPADPRVAALYRQSGANIGKPVQLPSQSSPAEGQEEAAPAAEQVTDAAGLDVDALTRAAQEVLSERRQEEPIVEHEAPFVGELRQSLKDQIPSIFYSAHKWATNPAERSVVLNGEVRRAGQQVKPGLRLVEILPESIVLEFQGTEFRLRSLNSWVNL